MAESFPVWFRATDTSSRSATPKTNKQTNNQMESQRKNLIEIFEQKRSKDDFVRICAPMVRYSKLAFRLLVRKYDCDVAFTPMILADAFAASEKARDNEFTTCKEDNPLVVQFAANNIDTFVSASQIVSPFCEGVDLNCGCPQRWACQEGLGACLIEKPEFLSDLVRQTRNQCRDDLSVSVKMRLHDDLKRTVDLIRRLESSGVSFVSVHGRTRHQKSSSDFPVNLEAISLLKDSVKIPVIANGDVLTLEDAKRVHSMTGVDGVMVARGLLENPALFQGCSVTPKSCVEDFIRIALETGTPLTCFHHHLVYMTEKSMSRSERKFFHTMTSQAALIDHLVNNYDLDIAPKQEIVT